MLYGYLRDGFVCLLTIELRTWWATDAMANA